MFITLHKSPDHCIHLNPEHIGKVEATGAFQKMQNPEWNTVLTVDGQLTYVTEKPEEVMELIAMAGFMSPIGKEILQGHPKEPPIGIIKGLETRGGELE